MEVGNKMDTMVKIGDQLRLWRMRRTMTQGQLADRSGVGINTIVRIERNQTDPRPSTIGRLATALGVDPTELIR